MTSPSPEPISDDELAQIIARGSATTAGPWKSYIEGRDHESGSDFIMTAGDDIELIGGTDADQDFIAHAKQDIPRLLLEIRRLRLLAGEAIPPALASLAAL